MNQLITLAGFDAKYTTIKKELLSIEEALRQYCSMLLGSRITVHTDHRDLTHHLSSFTTQHVMHWRILLKEYGPTFVYKKDPKNFIADTISHVPASRTPTIPPKDDKPGWSSFNKKIISFVQLV